MQKLPLDLTKTLYARFCTMWGDKFVKTYHDKEFIEMWWEDWSDGLGGIEPQSIKDAIYYCKLNLVWPPSIAEFREICEKSSGLPSVTEAMQSAIRREFNHPIVRIAFDKVGSWAMRNDTEKDLLKKFSAAYTEALNEFRANPKETWKLIEGDGNGSRIENESKESEITGTRSTIPHDARRVNDIIGGIKIPAHEV